MTEQFLGNQSPTDNTPESELPETELRRAPDILEAHGSRADHRVPLLGEAHGGIDSEYPITPEDPQRVTKQPSLSRLDGNRWVITALVTLVITAIGFFILLPMNAPLAVTGLFINIGLYLLSLLIRFRTRRGQGRLYGMAWIVYAMWAVIITCFIIQVALTP